MAAVKLFCYSPQAQPSSTQDLISKPPLEQNDGLLLDRGTLHQRAYAVIRDGLMSGRFQPGQKLLLRPLAKELGISVTPVREALLQLVSEQALTTDSSRSIAVPVVSLERFLEIRALRIELEGRAVEASVGLPGFTASTWWPF